MPDPLAAKAGHVDLNARLGEGEEVGLEARFALLAEERAGDLLKRAGQVRQRDVLGDGETLDLGEHRQVRGVHRVAAVDGAWHDHE